MTTRPIKICFFCLLPLILSTKMLTVLTLVCLTKIFLGSHKISNFSLCYIGLGVKIPPKNVIYRTFGLWLLIEPFYCIFNVQLLEKRPFRCPFLVYQGEGGGGTYNTYCVSRYNCINLVLTVYI